MCDTYLLLPILLVSSLSHPPCRPSTPDPRSWAYNHKHFSDQTSSSSSSLLPMIDPTPSRRQYFESPPSRRRNNSKNRCCWRWSWPGCRFQVKRSGMLLLLLLLLHMREGVRGDCRFRWVTNQRSLLMLVVEVVVVDEAEMAKWMLVWLIEGDG